MNPIGDRDDQARLLAAYALLGELRIRPDRPSAELAARIIDHLAISEPSLVPVLRYEHAEAVGQRMARRWQILIGATAPAPDDLAWADLVQFILRVARETAGDAARRADHSG